MIQASVLCPILPQHFQILFYIMHRYVITGWRDDIQLLMEDEGPNDESADLDILSSLDNNRFHEQFLLYIQQIFRFCNECDEISHLRHN